MSGVAFVCTARLCSSVCAPQHTHTQRRAELGAARVVVFDLKQTQLLALSAQTDRQTEAQLKLKLELNFELDFDLARNSNETRNASRAPNRCTCECESREPRVSYGAVARLICGANLARAEVQTCAAAAAAAAAHWHCERRSPVQRRSSQVVVEGAHI